MEASRGKWLSLFAAWLAMMMAGATFSFNLYTNAIKDTFNITQTEVTYLVSMVSSGLDNGIFPALLSRYTDTRGLSLAALILTPTGYFLIFHAFFWKTFYGKHSYILIVYFALAGFGTSFVFLASLTAAVNNFPLAHRAKAVGIVEGTLSGFAPTCHAILYSAVFSRDQYDNPALQNVQGYILFLAVGSTVAFLTCTLFLRVYPVGDMNEETTDTPQHQLLSSKSSSVNYSTLKVDGDQSKLVVSSETISPKKSKCSLLFTWIKRALVNTFSYLFSIDMQCLMWTHALIAGVASIFFNNNSVVLQSAGYSDYQPLVTILQPAVAVTSAFLASVTSDFFIDKCPRLVYVIAFSVVLGLTQIILMLLSDNIDALIYVTVISGSTTGFIWNLMVTIVSEIMGVENFGRNWGTVTCWYGITNMILQYMFGSLYDMYADEHHFCSGTICFRWMSLICSFLCFIATALLSVLLFRNRRRL